MVAVEQGLDIATGGSKSHGGKVKPIELRTYSLVKEQKDQDRGLSDKFFKQVFDGVGFLAFTGPAITATPPPPSRCCRPRNGVPIPNQIFQNPRFYSLSVSLGFGFLFLLLLNGFLRFQRESEFGAKSLFKSKILLYD